MCVFGEGGDKGRLHNKEKCIVSLIWAICLNTIKHYPWNSGRSMTIQQIESLVALARWHKTGLVVLPWKSVDERGG